LSFRHSSFEGLPARRTVEISPRHSAQPAHLGGPGRTTIPGRNGDAQRIAAGEPLGPL